MEIFNYYLIIRIGNTVGFLRWSFFQKQLTTEGSRLFLQKSQCWMFQKQKQTKTKKEKEEKKRKKIDLRKFVKNSNTTKF